MVYPDIDPEELGGFYFRHLSAMTSEGLHDKCKIAAQLALRDKRIDELERRLGEAETENGE